jgi:hypothetical protein
LRPDNIQLLVPVTLDLNTTTRVLTATFRSLDPLTNQPPDDVDAGFLPINNANHDGEGFFTYLVTPKSSVTTGTEITNQAKIIFGVNAPINTPTTHNTIDVDVPTSSVTAFSAATTKDTTFEVKWTGADTGSGVDKFSVFVSDNGGAFTSLLNNTTDTSTMFTGQKGHTYSFYTLASDHVGLVEAPPAAADATIKVEQSVPIPIVGTKKLTDADGDLYTIKFTGTGTAMLVLNDPDGPGGNDGSIESLTLTGTTNKSALSITVTKPRGGSGDGLVNIGSVTGDGSLKSITAAKSDITGDGINFPGSVAAISIHDLLNGADVKVGGTSTNKLSIVANNIGNGSDITSASQLSTVTTLSIGDGTITAPAIGTLLTKAGPLSANLGVSGPIKSISVKGEASGDWTAASLGTVKVTGGSFAGSLTSTAPAGKTPSITALTITAGDVAADVSALGKINSISVKGAASGDWSAGGFGTVTITGGDFTGSLTSTAAIGTLSISGGDLSGNVSALGKITTLKVLRNAKTGLGGSVTGATISAGSIGTFMITGDLMQSNVLAGANLGANHVLDGSVDGDDTFAAGSITSFTVGGQAVGSLMGAGFSTPDATFNDGNDSIIGGTASAVTRFSIGGAADNDSFFAAGKFPKTVKINKVSVTPLSDSHFFVQ